MPVAHHAELVDLSERRIFGRQSQIDTLRQVGMRDALVDDRARAEWVGRVFEREPDQGQAEQTRCAHLQQGGHAVQHALERDGNLTLDLLGGETRQLRNDGDLQVGDVGKRFHRGREIRPHAVRRNDQRDNQDRQPSTNAEMDQRAQHEG